MTHDERWADRWVCSKVSLVNLTNDGETEKDGENERGGASMMN